LNGTSWSAATHGPTLEIIEAVASHEIPNS